MASGAGAVGQQAPGGEDGPVAGPSRRRGVRRRAALGMVATVVAAAVAIGVVVDGDRSETDVPVGPGAVAAPEASVAPVVPTTTTTTVAAGPPSEPPPTAPPPAEAPAPVEAAAPVAPAAQSSTPVEPPADPRAPEPHVVLGMIEIPRIDLVAPLNQGISLVTIDRGPSHWPGSALPGQVGNAVVAGHRVTHTRPFRHIDRLVPGDEVVLTAPGVRATYAVRGHEVVGPDAMRIVDPTPTATLTLFACHPPGSARYRYVVTADLVRSDPLPH